MPSLLNSTSRRRWLQHLGAGLLALTTLGALPGTAAAADPALIRLGAPHGAIPGIKTAIEEGYFDQAGIKVELVTLAGGPNILAATVGGSLEVGFADLFAWVGSVGNGFDLAFLQSANGRGASDFIITAPNSGINTPADLKGKKIGVAAHAQSKLRVALYLERFGLTADDVQLVVINQRDTVGAALANGQIDAAIASDPNVAQWEHEYKVGVLEGRPWEQIPATATTAGFFATRNWVEQNPALAERFVQAARAGATRYNSYTPEQKAQISLKYDKVDLFAVERDVPGVIQRMDGANAAHDGPVDVAATSAWLDTAVAHGILPQSLNLAERLLPTATAP